MYNNNNTFYCFVTRIDFILICRDNKMERHPKLRPLRNTMRFIYNPKKKTFMERTCTSWLKILTFYLIFFAILCGLTAGMVIFASHLMEKYGSPIATRKNGPGMAHRPEPMKGSSIIWYKWDKGTKVSYSRYVKDIDTFLNRYRNVSVEDYVICNGQKTTTNKPCFFNVTDLGPCADPNYGYDENSPCIYLKLNKVFDWKPECYDVSKLPKEIPLQDRKKILEAHANNTQFQKSIFVTCDGINPIDEEHMGKIELHPSIGFNANFFPFEKSSKNYMVPLVAVKFLNPDPGLAISVRCNTWAKNIVQKTGHGEFQFYVGFKDS